MVHGFDLFFSLFNNLAIFIALVAVYRFMFGQFRHAKWFNRQLVMGVSFGIFAIGCMYAKIPVFKGVLVDQRNAVVALSGIFGGPLSAGISAIFAGSYRVYLGGDGVLGGVIGVCLAATAGMVLHTRTGCFASMRKAAACSLFATILILPGFLIIGDIWVGLRLLQAMALPYGLAVFSGIFLVGLLLNREEERHAIEQSFLESERRYRELVEGTEELITHVDRQGNYTFVNHVAGRIMGYSPRECVGMSAFQFVHPEDRERTLAWFEECVAKRRTQAAIENRQVNARTGEVRHINWSSSFKYDASGALAGIGSFARDVTGRKQAEAALAASEERLSLALDAANDGLWDWDVVSGRTYFSPRYSTMLGYAPGELEGDHETWRSLLHPDDLERVEAHLSRYQAGEAPAYEVEFRMRGKNGGWRWILSRGKAVDRDPEGRTTRMVGTHVDITARKELELRLADQLAFQQALMDTIPYAVFYKGADTRFLGFNTAYEEMFGIRREDLLGKRVLDLDYLPPADREAYQAEDQAVIASGGRVQKEMPIPFADGRVHQTLYSVSGFRQSDGSPGGLIGVIVDISGRKEAEAALAASEERFAKAFNSSPAPLVISEIASGKFIAVNDRWIEMLGFTREEQLGRTSKEVGIWADPTRRDEAIGILQAQGALKDFPIEFRTKAGQTCFTLWSAEVISLAGKNVLLSHIFDYSERKRAEEALRQSEEKFSRLFMLSPDNLALIEPETGRFMEVNEVFLRFHGLTREQVIGHAPGEMGLFVDNRQQHEMEAAMQRQGKLENFEVNARYWDGSARVGSISAQIVEIEGRPLIMSILRDITETKRMQEMMVQTEKMISVGGIAAGIAHEINNPLGIVLQATQNLVRRLKPDLPKNLEAAQAIGLDLGLLNQYLRARKLDVFIDDISSAAVRAAAIIRHMLDFSRRSESRRKVCDLPGIVRKAIDLAQTDYDLKKSYDFKRIQIGMEIGDDLPDINCTETEIEQVILNILRNAAQAMAEADPPVADPRLAIRLFAQPGGVRIEVEDNGPGIPPEVQRRIFEPFFTTKAPGVGTGLGLSVSYFIVTKGHGGRMKVESTPGEGARFIIELPTEDART